RHAWNEADADRRRHRNGDLLCVDAPAFRMAGMAISSEAERSGDIYLGPSYAVACGVPGLLHPGEAGDKTRCDGDAETRMRNEDGRSKMEDRRWKIEDGRSKMEDRSSIIDAILDPRSSILDLRRLDGARGRERSLIVR